MLNINKPKDVWKTRRKSWLVKCCMNHAGFKPEKMAKYLGVTESYLNTKLARNSWSLEDILIAMEVTGLKLVVVDVNGKQQAIRFKDWFEDTNPEVFERFEAISNEKIEEGRKLIEKKQLEIEEIKKQYGIKET